MTGKAMTLLSGQYVSRFLAFVGFVLLAAFAPAQQVDAVPYAAYVMDARTGETVSATAFLRGFSYEVGAATVASSQARKAW